VTSTAVGAATAAVVAVAAAALSPWVRDLAGSDSRWLRSGAQVLLGGLLGGGAAALASGWAELVGFSLLALACALLVVVDLAVHRLPDVLVGSGGLALLGALGLTALLGGSWTQLARAVVAGAVVLGCFLLLAIVAPSGLGLGDVKLAGLLGVFLGWQGWSQVVVGTLAAFVVNGLVVAVLLLSGRVTRRSAVAFGPWLVLGAVVGSAWLHTG
jgi:leader peptidase (prepilin peptidase)/N-methyltransferase